MPAGKARRHYQKISFIPSQRAGVKGRDDFRTLKSRIHRLSAQ